MGAAADARRLPPAHARLLQGRHSSTSGMDEADEALDEVARFFTRHLS